MTVAEQPRVAVPSAVPRGPRLWQWPALWWALSRRGDVAIDELFDRYGDVVWLPLPKFPHFMPGGARLVLLRDPALIKPLFTAPDELVDSAGANKALELLYGTESLFVINGPRHRRLRKVLLPGLRGDALHAWTQVIVRGAECEARSWIEAFEVELHPRMADLSLELILQMTLSVSDSAMPQWMPPMRELLETATSPNATFRYGLRQFGGLKFWPRFRGVRKHCDKLVYDEIARRRRDPERQYNDLLDLLMHAEGEPLTDLELRDQLFTILIGGHETSATAATWVIERLVRNPEVLAKATAEARGGDEHAYLDAVVQETLRLRPPLAFVGRITRQPFVLGAHHFPANTLIAPVIRSVHRAETLYDAPETFRPERFLQNRPTTYGHIPFGGGAHRCLGDRMGAFQTRVVVQTILRCADLIPVGDQEESIRRKALVYVPSRGGLIRATAAGGPRSAHEIG
jgi:cytochrome P450 family 135